MPNQASVSVLLRLRNEQNHCEVPQYLLLNGYCKIIHKVTDSFYQHVKDKSISNDVGNLKQ